MPIKLMYITNEPRVASIADKYGVDRIWIDLEVLGKANRQRGLNTVQSNHCISDIDLIKPILSSAELLVRSNPIHDGLKKEINEIIDRGADIVMLPYFKCAEDVKRFANLIDGRVKTILLVETIEAESSLEGICQTAVEEGIDEIHIGLNDLHLQYNMKFMFQLLANGQVEKMTNIIKRYNIPFGFGGIARLDEGLLPARHIIAEHYRLGSSMTILSRSFYDSWISDDYEEIERVFKYGIREIREYEERLSREGEGYFSKNQLMVKEKVDMILRGMEG